MCKSIPCTVLFLPLECSGILVVEKDSGTTCQIVGRLRFARSIMFPEFSYLFYKGFIFPSAGSDGYAVRSYYPIMILLCAVQRLAIAIRTDKIASTGKYTPHPQTDSSRKRLRINAPQFTCPGCNSITPYVPCIGRKKSFAHAIRNGFPTHIHGVRYLRYRHTPYSVYNSGNRVQDYRRYVLHHSWGYSW